MDSNLECDIFQQQSAGFRNNALALVAERHNPAHRALRFKVFLISIIWLFTFHGALRTRDDID